MSDKIKYFMPTEIYFGPGEIKRLPELTGGKKILLIIGQSYLRRSGWLAKIKKLLKNNRVELFAGVTENPDLELVERLVAVARDGAFDLLIGIGGGSVLDAAKAAALLANNQGKVISFLDKTTTIKRPGIKCLAVPTTAGSSSEVTPYSVITVPERGIKITLAHKYLYPDMAIIDPDLLKGVGRDQAANSGIDVLCHAVESYWSLSHNPISDLFALAAIKLVFADLPRFCRDRSKERSRVNMAKASLFAGLAFSNTRTTACHSISYPLTTIFGVPHGQACAITLSSFLLFNSRSAPERVKAICQTIGAKTPAQGAENMKRLLRSVGLKTRLRELGIKRGDIETIVAKGFTPERMKNNPRPVTRADLIKILGEIS